MAIDRRFLLAGTTAVAASAALPRIVQAQVAGPFVLPALPYTTNVLAPHIDGKTMDLHYDSHHRGYVMNLNASLKDYPSVAAMGLHEILSKLGEMPEAIRVAVRNYGGAHANHSMFWEVMGPGGGNPNGELFAAITRDFGGVHTLKGRFNDAGLRIFGTGWVMVTVTRDGKLALETSPNQDTPIMDGKQVLFGNDVWEHAYYLSYQNRRADYLKAWWNVVNWNKIAQRYAAAKAGTLTI